MDWRRPVFGLIVAISMGAVSAAAETNPRRGLPTTRQAPDEFGTQDYSVTVIPAGAFLPRANNSFASHYFIDTATFGVSFYSPGVFVCLGPGELADLYATADIPSGAIIDFIGLETDTPVFAAWGVDLVLVGRYNGQTVIGSVNSTVHGWDTDYNVAPLGFELTRNVHNALVVHVQEAGNDQACAYFGWVEIWWHRQVSPPPATATFPDVPTDHPFFQFVEALYASGITAGYGNGNFGVNDPITRGQMAVFLAKALGLHWPY